MIAYTIFNILPSKNIWKLESIVREEKIDSIISNDTIAIIYPELNSMWYNIDLLRLCYPKEECKEIIKAIKTNNIL
jgi:hypothetical protein